MHSRRISLVLSVLCVACAGGESPRVADTAFAALQQRGKTAMGVDQYGSAHVFEPLPDGGRIVLQMRESDPMGEAAIRAHMRTIATSFGGGDFAIPGQVHAVGEVPGTAAMSRLRGRMRPSRGTLIGVGKCGSLPKILKPFAPSTSFSRFSEWIIERECIKAVVARLTRLL